MKTIIQMIRPLVLTLLSLITLVPPILAQEVSIPDPALNAAIHEALGKPAGPLTQLDMLGLTNLGAVFRNITNVQGLEAAQNLVSLDLQDNRTRRIRPRFCQAAGFWWREAQATLAAFFPRARNCIIPSREHGLRGCRWSVAVAITSLHFCPMAKF